jgi:5-formyltetrahydrofolate cyclo-ligase
MTEGSRNVRDRGNGPCTRDTGIPAHPAELAEAKAALRRVILNRRNALDARERLMAGQTITRQIVELDAFRRSSVVLAYSSFGSELGTDEFIRHVLGAGKTLVLPRINRAERTLDLYAVVEPERDLQPGLWGILEPKRERCALVPLDAVEFVLVPGLAFDAQCRRLGYGGGFYDRLLGGSSTPPPLVAGAFETQIVDVVPAGADDGSVDLVITEQRRYSAR